MLSEFRIGSSTSTSAAGTTSRSTGSRVSASASRWPSLAAQAKRSMPASSELRIGSNASSSRSKRPWSPEAIVTFT